MPLPVIGHDEGRVRKLRESQPLRTPRR